MDCFDTIIAKLHEDNFLVFNFANDRGGPKERVVPNQTGYLPGEQCVTLFSAEIPPVFSIQDMITIEFYIRLSFFTTRPVNANMPRRTEFSVRIAI